MKFVASFSRAVGIGALILLALTECARGTAAPTPTASPIAPAKLPLIGVSLANVDATDATLIQKGLADNQRKNDVSLIYRSADGKAEKQASDIADLVQLNVVGLIVLPVDATLVAPPIAAAREKGIPVVAIATPPVGTGIDSLVRTDSRADGREAAKYVTDKSTAKGPVLIVAASDASGADFAAGAREGLVKASATAIVQTITAADPLDIAAIVTLAARDQGVRTIVAGDDALALAAMEALGRAGLTGVEIIGHGGTKEATRAVLVGTLAAEVDTRPQDLGGAAVGNIAALVRKKQPASDLIVRINGVDIHVDAVPGRLITRDNARDMQERWPDLVYVMTPTPTPAPKP